MDLGPRSRERVSDRIDRLERTYGSFSINQTTLTVPPEGYEAALERSRDGVADVYVEARNDDGDVLLVRGEDSWAVPRARTNAGESLEDGARRKVRSVAGVECTIEGIHQVTILGIADEADRERDTIYRLAVVFVCRCSEPFPDEEDRLVWRSERPERPLP